MSPSGFQRVDRRRRVFVDESRNEDSQMRPRIFRGDDEGPLARYDEGALRALNAPIAGYLPFRTYAVLVWFLVGLLPIMGLLVLDQRRFQLARWMGADALSIFQLNGRGNLTSWCGSMAMVICTLVILAIYSVRRHRRDDYRARFTVWQWAFGVALLASLDSATGLHGLLQGILDTWVGPMTWGAGAAWWVLAWALLISASVVRLAFEMSGAWKAFAWMMGGTLCYAWCAILQLELLGQQLSQQIGVYQGAVLLLGHHFVLFSLVSYARDVIREAMGILDAPRKAPQSNAQRVPVNKQDSRPSASQTEETSDSKARANLKVVQGPANEEKTSVKKPGKAKSSKADEPKPEPTEPPKMKVVHPDDEQPIDMSKLSRAERKRWKRELRRKNAA